ncbi:LysR family transcriptional regulator [Polyangium aurulentum]|uniref:LysR family transcriptional regulator n=1 Tax=Polyangium aurulentum TaxID=2567896 RepID=UPI0010ADE95B|nr:LysR family transcriptional regulator [Polyangium aurulentum]UQA57747.1 LysR family transcriptional regulator [Polyangium aurulentum]
MRKQSQPRPTLDDLASLAVFVRVAEARSFTAAARALGTTTSAVSKRIAGLEDRLGVRLIHRTTRRLSLSEAGVALFERAERVLADLESLEVSISDLRATPRGLLRVSGPLGFGESRLVPLLPAFFAQYPEVRVELELTDRFVDLVAERYDVAVRIGRLGDSTLVARKLGPSRLVVCAAPDYLARRGTPRTPEDLAGHDCLASTLVARMREWHFAGPDGEVTASVTGSFRTNHGGAMRAAVLAGVGLAVLPTFFIEDELASGAVVTVLDEYRLPAIDIFAVHPPGPHVPPKVRAFVEFLSSQLRDGTREDKPPPKRARRS